MNTQSVKRMKKHRIKHTRANDMLISSTASRNTIVQHARTLAELKKARISAQHQFLKINY